MNYKPQNIGLEIIILITKYFIKLFKKLFVFVLFFSCNTPASESKLADTDSLDGMTAAEWKAKLADSLQKDITKKIYLNFTDDDIAKAPVKVLSAKPVTKEYSSYKDISLSWKNVSNKTISAIRFRWMGTNAFGETADMGTAGMYSEGIGGGFSDDKLRPGKTQSGEWSILSRDLKKVTKAWPYEVVFEDGSKWKLPD